MVNIVFLYFPPVSDSVKAGEPYYWQDLELHHSYKVVSDYEKIKSNGTSEHFLLILNKNHKLQEIPLRDNIKVNFVS